MVEKEYSRCGCSDLILRMLYERWTHSTLLITFLFYHRFTSGLFPRHMPAESSSRTVLTFMLQDLSLTRQTFVFVCFADPDLSIEKGEKFSPPSDSFYGKYHLRP